jgi:hypothetical protein
MKQVRTAGDPKAVPVQFTGSEGGSMAIFGKRRAEEQAAAAKRRLVEEAQASFNQRFQAWVERLTQAQAEHGSAELTDEILAEAGRIPTPQADSLTDLQVHYLVSYARSFAGQMLEGKRIKAVVGADEADRSGRADPQGRERAVQYWSSVQAYVGNVLG